MYELLHFRLRSSLRETLGCLRANAPDPFIETISKNFDGPFPTNEYRWSHASGWFEWINQSHSRRPTLNLRNLWNLLFMRL